MTRKKLLLIVVVCVLAVSIPVTIALMHRGSGPPDGGGGGGTADVPTDDSTTPSTLTILSLTDGSIFVMKAGASDWIEAHVGMTLKIGDIVRSGNNSSAQITFFEGSTIDLDADTQIEVAALNISSTGSTTIGLRQVIGTTVSRVTQLVDTESSYEIETPACVAAVRGSAMVVKVIGGGITWVTNLEGHIWVTANGVELEVPEGQKCIITLGGSPQLVQSDEGGGAGGGGGGGGGSSSPNLDIGLTKVPGAVQAHEGDTITYTYSVTNSGDVPLSGVSVTDNMIEDVIYQSGDANGDGRLGTDEIWTFTASHNVTAGDPNPLVNTAAAAGSYAGAGTVVAWARASVDILRPAIALEKTADPVQARDGDTITYSYTVANTGNTPLSGVSVADDKIGNITYESGYLSGDTNGDGILDRDETWIFTATYGVTTEDPSPLVNTATVSGTDALARTVESEEAAASVTISRLIVEITHPDDGATITSSMVTVTGTVSDPAITQATIAVNGSSHTISVENGGFSSDENVSGGVNIITVSATDGVIVGSDTVSITVVSPAYGIRIELTWDTADTDLDAHLIRPFGAYATIPDDCFYANKDPDWGVSGETLDDPTLDQDDLHGYGTETITLRQPYEQGTYEYKVHYYTDRWHGPSTATVSVWINDLWVGNRSREMSINDVWDCLSIEWPSGQVTWTGE